MSFKSSFMFPLHCCLRNTIRYSSKQRSTISPAVMIIGQNFFLFWLPVQKKVILEYSFLGLKHSLLLLFIPSRESSRRSNLFVLWHSPGSLHRFQFSFPNKYARQILPEINCIIACGSSGLIWPDGLLYDRKAFYQCRNNSFRCSVVLVANGSWVTWRPANGWELACKRSTNLIYM